MAASIIPPTDPPVTPMGEGAKKPDAAPASETKPLIMPTPSTKETQNPAKPLTMANLDIKPQVDDSQQTHEDNTITPATTPQPVPTAKNPSDAMTVGSSNKSKFGMFIGVLIIVVLLIWAGVGYLFITNQQIENNTATNTPATANQ